MVAPNLDPNSPDFFSGYLHDKEDFDFLMLKSKDYLRRLENIRFSTPDEIPVDWFRIERQAMNDCQGFAQSSGGEFLHRIQTGKIEQFSARYAYITSQNKDGINTDSGSTISGGLKAAQQDGFVLESAFPYSRTYDRRIPDDIYQLGRDLTIRGHQWMKSYSDIFQWISSLLGPVVIGVPWTRDWHTGPVITRWTSGSRPRSGWHAVMFGGYSRRVDSNGNKFLRLVNSHGRNWGNDGKVEVAPGIVEYLVKNVPGVAMVGYSDLSIENVQPREIDWVKDSYANDWDITA